MSPVVLLDDITDNWWLLLVSGIVAIAFAILALFWPAMNWLLLLTYYAALCLLEDLFAVCLSFSARKGHRVWWQMPLVGALGTAAGIITAFWPGRTAYALLVIIASWAIVCGILAIAVAIRLRMEIRGEWMLILDGILSILLSCVLLAHSNLAPLTAVRLIAAFALATGTLLISFSVKLHLLKQHPPEDIHHATGT